MTFEEKSKELKKLCENPGWEWSEHKHKSGWHVACKRDERGGRLEITVFESEYWLVQGFLAVVSAVVFDRVIHEEQWFKTIPQALDFLEVDADAS